MKDKVRVFSHKSFFLDLGDVGCFGIIGAHAFLGFPCVPFGFAFHVEHAWAISVNVTDSALLEKSIEFELFFIREITDLGGNILRGHTGTSVFERHLLCSFFDEIKI